MKLRPVRSSLPHHSFQSEPNDDNRNNRQRDSLPVFIMIQQDADSVFDGAGGSELTHQFGRLIKITVPALIILLVSMTSASEPLPDCLISQEPEVEPEAVIVVEKETQRLSLYAFEDRYRKVMEIVCSTGEVLGAKSQKGDKKTPEGVYFFTGKFGKKYLSAIYGDKAFPMDYPNLIDRMKGHDGNSIWVHGTNKPVKNNDSNGCIVLANEDINKLAPYIAINRTPIVVVDHISYVPEGSNALLKQSLTAFLTIWNHTLCNGSYEEYLSMYDSEIIRDLPWWGEWRRLEGDITRLYPMFSVDMRRLSLVKFGDVVVALFDQVIRTPDEDLPAGTRKLFLKGSRDRFRIIGDEYQAGTGKKEGSDNPLIASCKKISALLDADSEIAALINSWIEAWASKDIKAYSSCYSDDFQNRGLNLEAWLRKRKDLNQRFEYIRVSKENLVIKKGGRVSTATFTQFYESSGYTAVGEKRLLLKREGGQWKIYRETWKKI